jgi:hypothetical protein
MQVSPERDVVKRAARAALAKSSLTHWIDYSSSFQSHVWQRQLDEKLEKLKTGKGLRYLIHAPPQVGKSQRVSKRLPVWLIGHNPLIRIIVAAYSKTQATDLIRPNHTVSLTELAKDAFGIDWAKWSDEGGGFTKERFALADSQLSLIGVGLDSGFTGKNADLLIIDDPYPNAEHARSEAYSRSVRSFWEETAEPRLMANPDANVVVMFHRYHENDIAGYLQTRGDWELITFPAIYRGQEGDPTGRQIGEVLSPFLTLETLLKKEADDPKTFAGQFQGEPIADGERLFPPESIIIRDIDQCPKLEKWFRYWDTATSSKLSSDDTAASRMAFDAFGTLHVRGFWDGKLDPAALEEKIVETADLDGFNTYQILEKANVAPAIYDYLKKRERLRPRLFMQTISGSHGDKRQRLIPVANLAYAKKVVFYKEGNWEKAYAQLCSFTGTVPNEKDDYCDTVSGGYIHMNERKQNAKTPKADITNERDRRLRDALLRRG